MRRTELTRSVGIASGVFNALSARDLLPFPVQSRRPGWRSYTADDALRLAIFFDITRAGRSQIDAAGLVRESYDDLIAYAEATSEPGPIMFGAIWTELRGEDGDDAAVARFPVIAAFGNADRVIAEMLTTIGQKPSAVRNTFTVNITATLEHVITNAEAINGLNCRFSELAELFGAQL